jgi:hypothetical protein
MPDAAAEIAVEVEGDENTRPAREDALRFDQSRRASRKGVGHSVTGLGQQADPVFW